MECLIDFSFDLSDNTSLKSVLKQIKPDIVIHCAGLTNLEECEKYPDLAYNSNVAVTKNIAQFCGSNNIKLIYISSDQIYGQTNDYSESNNILLSRLEKNREGSQNENGNNICNQAAEY